MRLSMEKCTTRDCSERILCGAAWKAVMASSAIELLEVPLDGLATDRMWAQ